LRLVEQVSRVKKILDLQSLKVKSVKQTKKDILVKIKQRRKTADCPHCGQARVKKVYDYRPQSKIRHLKIGSKPVYLLIRKRRFTCFNCGKRFTEQIRGIKHRAKVTEVAKWQALSQLKDGLSKVKCW
jgi:transposase